MSTKHYLLNIDNDVGTMIYQAKLPLEAAIAYSSFVDSNTEVEAFLWHVATIPSMEQRHRLLSEWKWLMQVIQKKLSCSLRFFFKLYKYNIYSQIHLLVFIFLV